MKHQHKLRLLFTICMFIIAVPVIAQRTIRPNAGAPGTWRLLGTTHARHTADHDAIIVEGPYDFFRRLKFKVTDAPLNLIKIVVRYDDGGAPEIITTRYEIPQGGESRVIDLIGGKRKLKSVDFWYDTKGFLNGQADVTLFGMK